MDNAYVDQYRALLEDLRCEASEIRVATHNLWLRFFSEERTYEETNNRYYESWKEIFILASQALESTGDYDE